MKILITFILILLILSPVYALRIETPPRVTEFDNNNLVVLNRILLDLWNITNGKYVPDIITTAPNGSRNGLRGEAVYYLNGTRMEHWVNSDGGTTWQQIDNTTTYGEIYVEGIDVDVITDAEGVYYQVESWSGGGAKAFNGESNNTTPDITNDHITILTTGVYYIRWHVSAYSGSKHEYEFEVFLNGGITALPASEAYRTTSVASAVGAISGGCVCVLTAGDTVELWVERKDGGGSPPEKKITIRASTLSLFKISD